MAYPSRNIPINILKKVAAAGESCKLSVCASLNHTGQRINLPKSIVYTGRKSDKVELKISTNQLKITPIRTARAGCLFSTFIILKK